MTRRSRQQRWDCYLRDSVSDDDISVRKRTLISSEGVHVIVPFL